MRVYRWWNTLDPGEKVERLWFLFKWFLIIGIIQGILGIVEVYIRMEYLGVT